VFNKAELEEVTITETEEPKSESLTLDSDNDELTNYEEINVYGTDPYNPDTDGDGYQDGPEVRAGYNPNGPGKLEELSPPLEYTSVPAESRTLTSATSSEEPTLVVEDETADWKTYRNGEYGFEIKYPPGWVLYNREVEIDLRNEEDPNNFKDIYIEMTTNQNRIEYIKEGEKGTQIIIAGIEWDRFLHQENNPGELGDFRTTLALLTSDRNRKSIIRLTPNEGTEIDQSFISIISTFKFVDP